MFSGLSTKKTLLCILLILLALPLATLAQSQAANGRIEGVVKDSSGGVLPGVTVVITNTETGIARTLLTDDNGFFRAPLLRVGKYDVDVTLDGFTPFKQAGITLTVGQTVSLNVIMQVAGSADEVLVTGNAEVVDTTKTTLSTTIDQNYISEIPLNGRNFKDLILLTPAVTTDGPYGQVSFNGIQGVFNNLTVDGADDNNAFFGEPRSRQSRAPFQYSQDAVKEFQVINNNYSAEFGRAAGGLINVVTKSGTNEIHGSAFYFLRHDALNARNFREAERPSDKRHQFGFSIGGPIQKDRLFYFINFDQQIRRQPITSLDPGIFQTFSASQIQSAADDMGLTVDQVQANLAAAEEYLAGTMSVDPRTGQFQGTFPRDFNQSVVMGKVDGNINDNNNFYITFNYQNFDGTNTAYTAPVQFQALSYNGTEKRKTGTLVGQWTGLYSPTLIGEFRAQYSWDDEPSESNAEFPRTDIGSYPNQYNIGRPTFLPRHTNEDRSQFVYNLGYSRGIHEIKTGVDINILKDDNYFPGTFGGRFAFSSLLDFAVGRYNTYYQNVGDASNKQTTMDFAWFFQDRIMVTDNFSLYAGIRYDYQRFDQPSVANPLYPLTAHLNEDKNNIAPRLGFNWSTADRKTSIRGGYGIFYARTAQLLTNTAMVSNGIVQVGGQMRRTDTGAPDLGGNWANILDFRGANYDFPASALYSSPDIYVFSPNRENPMVHQANLEIEREIVPDMTISVGYAFTKADHLPFNRNINLSKTGNVREFNLINDATGEITGSLSVDEYRYNGYVDSNFRNITYGESSAKSIYHGLVVQFRKRFSQGFSLLANYTWSKAIDTNPTAVSTYTSYTTTDQLDPHDRGLSGVDQRQVLNISGVFNPHVDFNSAFANGLLNDWKLAPRVRIGSGRPYSLVAYGNYNGAGRYDGNLNNDPYSNDRVLGRNDQRGPAWATVDFRLARIFPVTDTTKIELIFEGFNLFNHVNFYTPETIDGYYVSNYDELHYNPSDAAFNGNFRDFTFTTASDPRQFQVAVKFLF